MIKDFRTAYKIGFSDSLGDVISGYQEVLKWEFKEKEESKLRKAYYRGFREGFEIKFLVKKDLVAGAKVSDGSAVATLRSNEFNN